MNHEHDINRSGKAGEQPLNLHGKPLMGSAGGKPAPKLDSDGNSITDEGVDVHDVLETPKKP